MFFTDTPVGLSGEDEFHNPMVWVEDEISDPIGLYTHSFLIKNRPGKVSPLSALNIESKGGE